MNQAYNEYVQMSREESIWDHFTSIWNWNDLFALGLTLFVILATIQVDQNHISNDVIRVLSAFALYFTMIKIFDWLRLFDGTAFYVHLILETLLDITSFLLILGLTLLTFGLPMHFLNLNRSESDENTIIDSFSPLWGLNVVINQYFLALGEFNTDNFADNP